MASPITKPERLSTSLKEERQQSCMNAFFYWAEFQTRTGQSPRTIACEKDQTSIKCENDLVKPARPTKNSVTVTAVISITRWITPDHSVMSHLMNVMANVNPACSDQNK